MRFTQLIGGLVGGSASGVLGAVGWLLCAGVRSSEAAKTAAGAAVVILMLAGAALGVAVAAALARWPNRPRDPEADYDDADDPLREARSSRTDPHAGSSW